MLENKVAIRNKLSCTALYFLFKKLEKTVCSAGQYVAQQTSWLVPGLSLYEGRLNFIQVPFCLNRWFNFRCQGLFWKNWVCNDSISCRSCKKRSVSYLKAIYPLVDILIHLELFKLKVKNLDAPWRFRCLNLGNQVFCHFIIACVLAELSKKLPNQSLGWHLF